MIKSWNIGLLLTLLMFGCEKKVEISLTPISGSTLSITDSVLIGYKSSEVFDSVVVNLNGKTFNLPTQSGKKYCEFNTRYGVIPYVVTFYKKGNTQIEVAEFINKVKAPEEKKIKVEKSFSRTGNPHTQGFVIDNGILYKSSGEYGKSYVHKVDLKSMKSLKRTNLENKYFGEGCAIIGDDLYVLTWMENTMFKFNKHTLELIETIPITTDGWGLTTDGKNLFLSDGTQYIYTLSATDYKILNKVAVVTNNGNLGNINELEWIDGYIYANMFLYEHIAKINPNTGVVETLFDASGLYVPKVKYMGDDVLNGIAYDKKTKKIYITGKKWNKVYEVTL